MDSNFIKRVVSEEINKYVRSISGLMRNRGTLSKSLMNACTYPYSEGQVLVYGKDRHIIDEGLVKTYPSEKSIEYVSKELEKEDMLICRFLMNRNEKGIVYAINVVVDGYLMNQAFDNKINKLFDFCGYYCSSSYWMEGNKEFVYQFEPKFSGEDEEERPRYLYHITKEANVSKIQRLGFIPKSRNELFNYPPRCYFFTVYDVEFMKYFMERSRKGKEGDKFIIITVDTSLLKDDVKFWRDNLFVGEDIAVYTYDNIPSSAIVKYEEVMG